MADNSMFSQSPPAAIVNSEGALLLQLVFQIFKDSDVLNEHFENCLGRVVERLKILGDVNKKSALKKHLLQVFLAALYYNPFAGINFMINNGILKDVLMQLFETK